MAIDTQEIIQPPKPGALPLDPRIGQKWSYYQIRSQIGQGGMSVVYRAEDERTQNPVAIKVLHSFLAQKHDYHTRLIREAKTVAQLKHPHIVEVYAYATSPEVFLVTEFVPGETLGSFAKRHHLHQVPELGALIIWEIARALAHAHEHGVVHRDIKPENIMVRKDGVLKLMDFGIAQASGDHSLTLTGTLLGSPAHMAPESIEGKRTDARSDIFSLTTVLYWLVCNQLPFEERNPHALLKSIAEGHFVSPQHRSPLILDALNDVILKGMSTDPAHRFQSAHEMSTALEDALLVEGLSPSSEKLQSLLSHPETIPAYLNQIRLACLKEVKEHRKNNQTAKAFSVLNRLLAQNPNDSEALSLLKTYEVRFSRKKRVIFSATFTAMVFLGTLMGFYFFYLIPQTVPPLPSLPTKSRIPALIPPPITEPVLLASTLSISITPYADLYVDGKKIGANLSQTKLKLPFGKHVLTFKHQYAATQERTLTLTKDNLTPSINITLEKSKPASLVVFSNVDADIAISGLYKGTSEASHTRPVIIALPDKTQSLHLDVVVSKAGYQPRVMPVEFTAGQTKILKLDLIPNNLESPPH